MGLKEAVAHSLNSSHLESLNERETDIDRVGAISRASKLGSALWRWRYAGDSSAAPSAFSALLRKAQRRTKVYRHSKDFRILQRVCQIVLSEWYSPNCRTCNGACEFVEANLRVVCKTCNGTGKHNHDDQERMAQLGAVPKDANEWNKWDSMIKDVWLCLSGADAGVMFVCRYQLERK